MTVKRILGQQGQSNTSWVPNTIQTDEDYTATTSDDIIFVVDNDDVTITLPDNPYVGEEILICADEVSGTIVDGGAHPLFSGPLGIALNGRIKVLYAPTQEWLIIDDLVSNAFLTQNVWFIDPVNGKDGNSGLTAAKAIKTWAQMQFRWGTWTTLNPTGGLLTINVLNDLPSSDQITVQNFLAPGAQVFVFGQKKVLSSGSLSAVVDKDRSTNTPWQITAAAVPANYWSAFTGKMVEITSGAGAGAHAFVARDFGAQTAHMSEWLHADIPGMFAFPDTVPTAGNGYRVVDYTQATWGYCMLEASGAATNTNPGVIPPPGIQFVNFHLLANESITFGASTADILMVMNFEECILDAFVNYSGGNQNTSHMNCCHLVASSIDGDTVFSSGGLWLNAGTFNGINVFSGNWAFDGDPTLVGTDILFNGNFITAGAISFWDCGNCVRVNGPNWLSDPFTPFGFETSYIPLWGNGNAGLLNFFPRAFMNIQQFAPGNGGPLLPTLELASGPGGVVATVGMGGEASPTREQAIVSDFSVSPPVNTTLRNLTWANLGLNIAGGGFIYSVRTAGPFTIDSATPFHPNTFAGICWQSQWS